MKEIYLDALAESITDIILLEINIFFTATLVINICYVLNIRSWIAVPVIFVLAFLLSFIYSLYTIINMKWTTSDINSSLVKATTCELLENFYIFTLPALYVITMVLVAFSTNIVGVVISIITSVVIIPSVVFGLVYVVLWADKRKS